MLSVVVILCLASSHVFGAAINNAHSAAHQAGHYNADSAHSQGSGSVRSYNKDYGYEYDQGRAVAYNAVNGGNSYGYGQAYPYAAYSPYYYAPHHNGYGYNHGPNQVSYVAQSHNRGKGYGHESGLSKDYQFSNSNAHSDGAYQAGAHHGVNNYVATPYYYNNAAPNYYPAAQPHIIHKRATPWSGARYNSYFPYGYNNYSPYGFNNYSPYNKYGYNPSYPRHANYNGYRGHGFPNNGYNSYTHH